MKTFFRNLKIKTKLLTGFGIIVLILLISGLREIALLNNLEQKRIRYTKTVATLNMLKESRLLISYEMTSAANALSAQNNKELREAQKRHLNNNNKLISIFEGLNTITNSQKDFKYNNENKLIKDSVKAVFLSYTQDFNIAYDKLIEKKANYLDIEEYYGEYIKLNIQNDSTKHFSKAKLASTLLEEILDLSQFIKTTGNAMLRKLKSTEEISGNITSGVEEETSKMYMTASNTAIIYIFIIIILSVSIALLISRMIVTPINSLKQQLDYLSNGELPEKVDLQTTDEIGQMSEAINSLVIGLNKTSEFSIEIGKGNFDSSYTPLGTDDILGNSLLSMRDSLQTAKKGEEKRKIEDAQRNRTSEGLALFSEILRKHTENIKDLSNEIISGLVKFMNANQGGIFILNDDNKNNIFLDLLGAYAYNRIKFLNKQVRLGEGLVGSVAAEKYTVYMTDIPDEYIEIESGIGSSNPKSILIVPLKIEQEVLGVIELASFNEFEKYEIELVERIAESIASSLSTARINTRTAMLLEQSNKQAAKMREQEEEMLQNIEELKATQEESDKREEQLRKTLSELRLSHKIIQKREIELDDKVKNLQETSETQIENITLKEKFNDTLIENSINAIIISDPKGNISKINRTARQLFEIEEYNTKKLKNIFPDFFDKNNIIDEKIIINQQKFEKKLPSGNKIFIKLSFRKQEIKENTLFTFFIDNITKEVNIENENKNVKEKYSEIEFESLLKIDALEKILETNKIDISSFNLDEVLRWDNTYSIGIEIIDQQHKRWIHLTNQLYRNFKKDDFKVFIKSLKELIDYTDYHFGFEEKYMSDFGYENANEHKNLHKYFLDKLKEHNETIDQDNKIAIYNLLTFLKFWIKKHIQNEDINYVDLFISNGLT